MIESTSKEPDSKSQTHVLVPRRVLYAQACLLAVSSVTFFLFGMMVANLTMSPSSSTQSQTGGFLLDCRVQGQILTGSDQLADVGAVVILLPHNAEPKQRLDPTAIMPDTFVSLDNPAIDKISGLGGAVVQTDDEGRFEILVDPQRQFRMWVLSKNRKSTEKAPGQTPAAQLEKWFDPPLKLIADNEFKTVDVETAGEQYNAGRIEF